MQCGISKINSAQLSVWNLVRLLEFREFYSFFFEKKIICKELLYKEHLIVFQQVKNLLLEQLQKDNFEKIVYPF